MRHRRLLMRAVIVLSVAVVLVLVAHPGAGAADVFENISPAPQLPAGGWVGRYPVNNYSLDQYFSAVSVGLTSGIDTSGVDPMIAYFVAQVIWLVTCGLANGVILLFALAFNLNLLTGDGTPGSGALTPVANAIHNLYTSTFGAPWLIAMVTLIGCWAMWKALVQRRYTETASALLVSLLFFVVAVGIVTAPERTIAPASKLSNQLSTALLSLTSDGTISSESQAKTAASDQLFELLVLDPWTVLEFGGIEHCATVTHGKPRSVPVRPLSPDPASDTQLARRLEEGTELTIGGKTCVNDRNKYAARFLAFPFQSARRNREHEALEHGDSEDLPASDPDRNQAGYRLGPADEPAAEAMGKGGQYQRLLLAIVILGGETGAFLLLGALAAGVILAQILLLMLLAFAPVALLVGILPGRGHDFFRAWLAKLAGYLIRKVIYSLILAVVLAVCSALDDATSNLGWLLAFTLQAAFLWAVFLQRDRLTKDLLTATVGPRATLESTSRLAGLYYATRLAGIATPHGRPPAGPPASAAHTRSSGPSAEPTTPPSGGEQPPSSDGPPPPQPVGPQAPSPAGPPEPTAQQPRPVIPRTRGEHPTQPRTARSLAARRDEESVRPAHSTPAQATGSAPSETTTTEDKPA